MTTVAIRDSEPPPKSILWKSLLKFKKKTIFCDVGRLAFDIGIFLIYNHRHKSLAFQHERFTAKSIKDICRILLNSRDAFMKIKKESFQRGEMIIFYVQLKCHFK